MIWWCSWFVWCVVMVADVSLALCIAVNGGIVYAFMVSLILYLTGLPVFYVCVLDGSILILFLMENFTLLADLNKKVEPDAALVKTDKMQRELIRQLSQQRAALQRRVLRLEVSLKRREALLGVTSKSCGDLFDVE